MGHTIQVVACAIIAAGGAMTARAGLIDQSFGRLRAEIWHGGVFERDEAFFDFPASASVEENALDITISRVAFESTGDDTDASFWLDSAHEANYRLGTSRSRGVVEFRVITAVDAFYEISGGMFATDDALDGSMFVDVRLGRWEGVNLVETLFSNSNGVDIGSGKVDLPLGAGGDLEGSLTGLLLAGRDYHVELTYELRGDHDFAAADGSFLLDVTAVPNSGGLVVLGIAGLRWGWPRR